VEYAFFFLLQLQTVDPLVYTQIYICISIRKSIHVYISIYTYKHLYTQTSISRAITYRVATMKGLSLLLIRKAFRCCLFERLFVVAYIKGLSLLPPYAARQCTPYIVTSLWQTNPTEIPFSLANEPYRNRALFQKGLMWWL